MRINAATVSCLAAALLIVLNVRADALTRRHRKRSAVSVALQPFLFARSAVHAAADPIVFDAPRAVVALASAPLLAAYHNAGPAYRGVVRGELVDEDELNVPAAQAGESEPIHAAYYSSRVRQARPPRAERPEAREQDDEEADGPRQAQADRDETSFTGGAKPMVSGSRAVLRNGVAYAPSSAPQSVKNAIWSANSLRRKPYVWGGGHGSFDDRGYDCSGTVSFALHHAGTLAAPIPSSGFMRYGERGRGRWITIYSRSGHTFAMIAGLRLDTTDFQSGGNVGPRWHIDGRDTFGYIARHPAGL